MPRLVHGRISFTVHMETQWRDEVDRHRGWRKEAELPVAAFLPCDIAARRQYHSLILKLLEVPLNLPAPMRDMSQRWCGAPRRALGPSCPGRDPTTRTSSPRIHCRQARRCSEEAPHCQVGRCKNCRRCLCTRRRRQLPLQGSQRSYGLSFGLSETLVRGDMEPSSWSRMALGICMR